MVLGIPDMLVGAEVPGAADSEDANGYTAMLPKVTDVEAFGSVYPREALAYEVELEEYGVVPTSAYTFTGSAVKSFT
ncbi:hypothetical protein, partial [Alicyclobacillus acidiphilus]|uniref:hypothetical protein n=1 Tax=Alicyclobacillus acidiphilus TaxID=182455 RepID=UPI001C3F49C2